MRLALLAAVLLLGAGGQAAGAGPRTLVVAPDGPCPDLAQALAQARDGDTVVVRGGRHAGPLRVRRQVRLIGSGRPLIDGGGRGTVVQLAAPGIVFQGFRVAGSGDALEDEDAGISVEARGVVVADNELEDVLFGIYLRRADGAVVRRNRIVGKPLPLPRRGDPIRVWYSRGVTIERNEVEDGRDVVLWYSRDLTVRGNLVRGGRYGLHFMYSDVAVANGNRLVGNSVGVYLMYSRGLRFHRNVVYANRGPSGYGLGLKDMDDVSIEENLFADNRVGAFVDNSPRSVEEIVRFRGNAFAFNDVALELMPAVRGDRFSRNSFIQNEVQFALWGGGRLVGNRWAEHGVGNYWSDYVGFDADGNGIGDVPYRSEQLYDALTDQRPLLRLFLYSPAAEALDLAGRAFPLLRPEVRLTDPAPLVRPALPEGLPPVRRSRGLDIALASAGLLALTLALAGVPRLPAPGARVPLPLAGEGDAVRVEGLTKRYGELVAVGGISFSVGPGEAVALWGANGAGKTTILHCLLGLLRCEGELRVAGHDVRRQGQAARSSVGFAPQELNLHEELTVAETAAFYARLKRAPADRAGALLQRFGLAEQSAERVGSLSGGTRQKLALALALLSDPPVLLLDEPTANLDPASRRELLELLGAEKARGKAILFASHRLDEVMLLADRVLVLESGRLATAGAGSGVAAALAETSLRLRVGEAEAGPALRVLTAAGFPASRNGASLLVRVPSDGKALPICVLAQSGILVDDFELEA